LHSEGLSAIYASFTLQEGGYTVPLARSQVFYRVFQASPIGIAVEDLEGRPLFANPALCSMLGFSEEEMRGKRCIEFSPPEDAQRDGALFEQLRAGSIDHYQLEKRFFRRDGSLLWGRLTISLLSALAPPLVVAMVEDVTERRKAREERSQYAAIVESSDDAIISKSLDGVIRSWNTGAERMFGYAKEEMVGQPFSLIPPELLGEQNRILERLAAGEHIEHFETRRLAKDGKPIDVSLTVSPIKNADGIVVGICKIARNVTERKRAESALSTFSQRLIDAQEQERSRLARELHDNISQQLALLAINLEGIKLGLPASAAELLARHIDDASNRVADLSKDIQALSHRLHSPKLELLGLAAAAASFCQEFSTLQKVQIDFHSENIPKDLPKEISLCLFRVLQEALQNAAKHSESMRFQVVLTCETNLETSQIELTVHDRGVGFQPEEASQGRGLGLTSMKERLKLVEGELLINSRLHEGSTLCARVPLSSKKKSASAGS